MARHPDEFDDPQWAQAYMMYEILREMERQTKIDLERNRSL